MNHPGKLQTVSPSLRTGVEAPVVATVKSPARKHSTQVDSELSISTGDAKSAPVDTSNVRISLDRSAKAAAGFFSIQNLVSVLPGWTVSLTGHAIVLILLALIANVPLKDLSELQIDGLMVENAEVFAADEMLIDHQQADVELQVDVAALNSEASENSAEVFHEDGLRVSMAEGLADGIGLEEAMAETGLIPVGDEGKVGGGEGTTTSFFGTSASGDRFVFIIDASDSMNEGIRWHQALRELEKSIDELDEKQRVLVLLYNFQTYPMFNTPPDQIEMLPATDEFKISLKRWLSTQVPTGGTRPAHALNYSLSLKPDAIFLLSDGQIVDNSIEVLAQNNTKLDGNTRVPVVPVHTVSLGPHAAGAEIMKFIAEKNNGEFSWVQ